MPEGQEDHSLERVDRGVLERGQPLQGEVLPAAGWTPQEVRWFRKPAFILGSIFSIGLVGWLLSNFLQMRGIVNDIASRVCLWTATIILVGIIWPIALRFKRWRLIAKVAVALFSLGLIWGTYKLDMATVHRAEIYASDNTDEDEQFEIFNLKPEQKAKLDTIKGQLFKYKAEMLDLSSYKELTAKTAELRDYTESLEIKYNCVIDLKKGKCLPKPPPNFQSSGAVGIDVTFSVVAEELSKNNTWIINDHESKLRVPILLFVTITNLTNKPIKIDLLYVEAKNANGWAVYVCQVLSPLLSPATLN